jgi:hypothetical protein
MKMIGWLKMMTPYPPIKDVPSAIAFFNAIVKRWENGKMTAKELSSLGFVGDKALGAIRLEAELNLAEIRKELELLRSITGVSSRETALAQIAQTEREKTN